LQGRSRGHRPQPARRGRARLDPGRQILKKVRDRRAGELYVPVTTLAPFDEQAAVDEAVQVLGSGGGRDPGVRGQLSRGPRAAVE